MIRILNDRDGSILGTTKDAPNLGRTISFVDRTEFIHGYRVDTRHTTLRSPDPRVTVPVVIQYARKVSDLETTVDRVRLLPDLRRPRRHAAGAASAACWLAGRAMRPIAALTPTAREIAETRDPDAARARAARRRRGRRAGAHARRDAPRARRVARGDRGRARAPAPVRRRRVARAAHAADQRAGQPRAARRGARRRAGRGGAQRAALLAAHAPPGRRPAAARARRRRARGRRTSRPTSAQVVVEAAAELGPVADGHELDVDAEPAVVAGVAATSCTGSRST